jgi:hypothetical protein
MRTRAFLLVSTILTAPAVAGAATIQVTPATTIAAAVASAKTGDTLVVGPGAYTARDVKIDDDLTIQCQPGAIITAPTAIVAGGNVAKGVFIVGTSTSSPNVSMRGCDVSGAKSAQSNGAAIRFQAGNLALDGVNFHDNQDGILAPPFVQNTGKIVVTNSKFDHNGAGDGQSHNLYIGLISEFDMENSISTDANVGHEVKSRAYKTRIINNQIIDGPAGTASYGIDLPDGGDVVVQGNTVEKGSNASTPTFIHIGGGEQQNGGPVQISGNTLVNKYKNPRATNGVHNQTLDPVSVQGNLFQTADPGTLLRGVGTASGNQSVGGVLPAVTQDMPLAAKLTTDLRAKPGDQTVALKIYQGVMGGAGKLTVTGATDSVVVGGPGGMESTGGFMAWSQPGSTNTFHLNGSSITFSNGNDMLDIATGRGNHVNVNGNATAEVNASSTTGPLLFFVKGHLVSNEHTLYWALYRVLPGGLAEVHNLGAAAAAVRAESFDGQGGTVDYTSADRAGVMTGYFAAGKRGNVSTWRQPFGPTQVNLKSGEWRLSVAGDTQVSGDGDVNATVYGAPNLVVRGGAGKAIYYLGAGSARVQATMGTGVMTVTETSTSASATYALDKGSTGTLTVRHFRPGTDKVHQVGNVVQGQGIVNGVWAVKLSSGGTINLPGVTAPVTVDVAH